jgi:hypothetical protein
LKKGNEKRGEREMTPAMGNFLFSSRSANRRRLPNP